LFDFYRNEIAKDRTLVLKENRQTLDLRAQEQFETRSRLLKEARERQSEAEETKRRLDRENSLIEERKREEVILKNRQTRKKRLIWISKFVVAPLMVLIIALSFWINARQSAALTAKQHQESLELCPLGPTLSFLDQKLLTMSPSEVGKEPFASDLENAISRLDSLSTGRQANTGIDAVRYLSIDLTYLRNPMSDNLMIERISKARNQLRVVTSISNPKTCGNTGIPFAASSNVSPLVSTDTSQTSKSAATPKGTVTSTSKVPKAAKPKTSKDAEPEISRASIPVSGGTTPSTRKMPYLYGFSRYFYCGEFDCGQEAGWIICANLVDQFQPDNLEGQDKYIGLVSNISALLRPNQLYSSDPTPEPVLLTTSHKWLDDVTSPNDKLKRGEQFCGRFKTTKDWSGTIELTWTFSNGFVSSQRYHYSQLISDRFWSSPDNTASIQGWQLT
jgi:hypothetical protein